MTPPLRLSVAVRPSWTPQRKGTGSHCLFLRTIGNAQLADVLQMALGQETFKTGQAWQPHAG